MTGGLPGAADRAAAGVRALDRADDDVTTAVGLLVGAAGVTWTGAGAAAYRDDVVAVLDAVRRARESVRAGRAAVAAHAAALRELEACVPPAGAHGGDGWSLGWWSGPPRLDGGGLGRGELGRGELVQSPLLRGPLVRGALVPGPLPGVPGPGRT